VTRRHRVLAGVVASLGWAVIAVLWVVTGARIVAWDKWEVFAALDAFTLVLFLPAWPIAVLALWRRRWVLAGASVLMAATQVVLVAPELSAARPLPRHLHGATKLRIFDANVYEANPSMAGYAAEIRRDRPDIVTLEEATPNDVDQLAARGALDRLPYQFWNRAFDSRSLVIISRYPLGPTSASAVDGQPYLARTTVEVPRRPYHRPHRSERPGVERRARRHPWLPAHEAPGPIAGRGGLQCDVGQPGVPGHSRHRARRRRRRPW
jgi:hypothetical protein